MDWNDLRYFLAIARTGTLVKAGKQLGVEHSTVGRRLSALEAALGAKLFARGPEGLSLTAAGQTLLPSAEAIAAHIEEIGRRVSGGDARIEGTVRVTIPEAVNAYMIQVLTGLRERHPALLVEVLSDNRAFDLRRGEADLALRVRGTDDPELISRKVGSAAWSLYASPDYIARKGPLANPGDLQGHDVIGFAPSLIGVVGGQWLETHARTSNVVLRANSLGAALDATVVGFGLAPLPCFMGDSSPVLRRLVPGLLIGAHDITLVAHPDLARVARVRATMDYLIEVLQRDAALWSGETPALDRRGA